MFNNVTLDVFIGLVFIFLLYSLLATIIQEIIATWLGFRSKVLEKAIVRMLEDGKTTSRFSFFDRITGFLHLFGLKNILKDKKVVSWFYAHPLIKYLGEDNYYSKPAYIDASNFSKVIIDLLKGFNQPESQAIQSIHNSVTTGKIYKLPIKLSEAQEDKSNPAFKSLIDQKLLQDDYSSSDSQTVDINPSTAFFIKSLWLESGADLNKFKLKLEDWFNDTMDRATGWYKKYTRLILFIIGFFTACLFNVDTIAIHRILSTNKTAREQMVQLAIQEKDNLNPKEIPNALSDSILKETYKMVSDDAKLANDILGLGSPWRDSCKTCEEYYNCDKDLSSLKSDASALSIKINNIERSQASLDSCNQQIDSMLSNKSPSEAKKNLDSIKVILNARKLSLLNILKANNSDRLLIFRDSLKTVNTLNKRCPVILNAKLFQSSPNQRGGFETLLGWIIAALAISLGAPFWFDLLSKLVNIRGAGNSGRTLADGISRSTNPTSSPGQPNNSTTINVNSNAGEEAVG